MWSTVLFMAVIESIDPVRFGLTAYLLSRPRPVRLLLAFFVGGFSSNVVVGCVVLFATRNVDTGDGRYLSAPMEIALGVLFVLVGALVYSGLPARLLHRLRARRTDSVDEDHSADDGPPALESVPGIARLPEPIRRVLRADTPVVALGLGLASGWPTPYYFAAIASILIADPSPQIQVSAIVAFCLVAFTAALIAVACFWLAPEATRDRVDRAYNWTRAHHRLVLSVILAVIGLYFIGEGLRHL